jgi:hypothetical protein
MAGKHAVLVGASLVSQEHAESITCIDHCDKKDERDDLILFVVLAHLGPSVFRYIVAAAGDLCSFLGKRQSGPFRVREDTSQAPNAANS